MNYKLLNLSIVLMSVGVVGLIIAVVLEIQTGEPTYFMMMKITAGLFGVGGPLFGWALTRGKKKP